MIHVSCLHWVEHADGVSVALPFFGVSLQRVAEEVDDRDWRTRAPVAPLEAGRESKEGAWEQPGEARQPQPRQQQAEQQQQQQPRAQATREVRTQQLTSAAACFLWLYPQIYGFRSGTCAMALSPGLPLSQWCHTHNENQELGQHSCMRIGALNPAW